MIRDQKDRIEASQIEAFTSCKLDEREEMRGLSQTLAAHFKVHV